MPHQNLFFNLTQECHKWPHCNFAHWLSDLQTPEEKSEQWSHIWAKGDVDINFWEGYCPSEASRKRFRKQFTWEHVHSAGGIPNWAWGHAVNIGILNRRQVPQNVPADYDWPWMQSVWQQKKMQKQSVAVTHYARQLQNTLMQNWEEAKAMQELLHKKQKEDGALRRTGEGSTEAVAHAKDNANQQEEAVAVAVVPAKDERHPGMESGWIMTLLEASEPEPSALAKTASMAAPLFPMRQALQEQQAKLQQNKARKEQQEQALKEQQAKLQQAPKEQQTLTIP